MIMVVTTIANISGVYIIPKFIAYINSYSYSYMLELFSVNYNYEYKSGICVN